MGFTLDWNIREEVAVTIKEFLKNHKISKSALTDIKFKGGRITVNGLEQNVKYKLNKGDHLAVIFPPEKPSEGLIPESIPLPIVYEDDFLLIVKKVPGMNTIPSREHPKGSLANALVGYYQAKRIEATIHIVTRLDRDTSGLVLIAKHRHIHHLLSGQQKTGDVKRKYLAFAEGTMKPESGTINEPIGRCVDSIIQREVREDGKNAITHYRVLTSKAAFSIVELSLETGRTHQIRVHLSHLGHPLLGDDLYGGSRKLISRQALHCYFLSFTHPITDKKMAFSIDLPDDLEKVIEEEERS
ncbi:RluA family pseudouridine synthase [Bacillus sp. B1-b2]|uniref:RluA family pseudouridine synthase n=1 Tax=Bacillus sp. B1-b2 TaxID=2653201 RepID=UPI001261C38F|nr:RluA family pseudouridine synthase [Bacillus sp. B1-b2]KAB7667568.1 RluA family pseudouridine synthase [Bacillus sp. B1-b2]